MKSYKGMLAKTDLRLVLAGCAMALTAVSGAAAAWLGTPCHG